VPLPSTSSDKNGSKVVGPSPDNYSVHASTTKEEHGHNAEEREAICTRNLEEKSSSKPSTFEAENIKSRQPSSTVSCPDKKIYRQGMTQV
jgi:hypothetical protein